MPFRKIINDPVHGFINIDDELIFEVIRHPFYQRLRRIHQMALAYLVYPGAVHTRLNHSLGAYHLMSTALDILRKKGVEISDEEDQAAKLAILLHDVGHGPFSHALESQLEKGLHHEDVTLMIMNRINEELDGALSKAIEIFTGKTKRKFLHQLVSSQLDVDRMDYLIRDSFFTGVSEGVIGYDRILNMLCVHKDELMVEEKGIQSIEKFLVSRRFMYWQVYHHKTVLCAEKMLINALRRSVEMKIDAASPVLNSFLKPHKKPLEERLDEFCRLDDVDVLYSIKEWANHKDTVLSSLSKDLINRNLLKIQYFADPVKKQYLDGKRDLVMNYLQISPEDAKYMAFSGTVESRTYNPVDDHINILFKDGSVKDISEVDNPLITPTLFTPVKKFYICYINFNLHKQVSSIH
jgi:HD superfamily phosphohydrolase